MMQKQKSKETPNVEPPKVISTCACGANLTEGELICSSCGIEDKQSYNNQLLQKDLEINDYKSTISKLETELEKKNSDNSSLNDKIIALKSNHKLKLNRLTGGYDARIEQLNNVIKTLEIKHEKNINELTKDYDSRLQKKDQEIEDLNDMINSLTKAEVVSGKENFKMFKIPRRELIFLEQLAMAYNKTLNDISVGIDSKGVAVEVEDGHVTKLRIDSQDLKIMPESIENLTHLRHIIFYSPIRFPESFANLNSLIKLEINKHYTAGFEKNIRSLDKIPEVVYKLKNLHELIIHNKYFDGFSEDLGNLTSLERIKISEKYYGGAGKLPNTINNLVNLEELSLPDMELDLPDINNLSKLKKLVLYNKGRFCIRFGNHPELTYLDLSSFHFKSLPGIDVLTKLTHLIVNTTEFPNVENLKNLVYLRIEGFDQKEFPNLLGLKNLKELCLHSHTLKPTINDIELLKQKLPNLEKVNLGYDTYSNKISWKVEKLIRKYWARY